MQPVAMCGGGCPVTRSYSHFNSCGVPLISLIQYRFVRCASSESSRCPEELEVDSDGYSLRKSLQVPRQPSQSLLPLALAVQVVGTSKYFKSPSQDYRYYSDAGRRIEGDNGLMPVGALVHLPSAGPETIIT
jgi:hypothetical protein